MTLLSNRKFQIPPQRHKRRQQQPSQAPPNKVIDDNGNGEIDDDSAKNDVDNIAVTTVIDLSPRGEVSLLSDKASPIQHI